jgi:hypothetical protein
MVYFSFADLNAVAFTYSWGEKYPGVTMTSRWNANNQATN